MVKRFVVVGVACGLAGSAVGANLALLADSTDGIDEAGDERQRAHDEKFHGDPFRRPFD